ncbi:DUF3810 domain-containing protein [Sphingobacterium sp. lm-10]|uniref:DUF3810 domain-containing protein n=1 Tax=Sphingobacterium sp. lm-10 TaxID=2944904 RepID=UPI002020D452|nr:DUF3810 domain-containing protein [Sphingobacterium sp. lm-10]MCL7986823.1 DUF3810 domain-containing protein [Sphingobacterium sp. lm-10]
MRLARLKHRPYYWILGICFALSIVGFIFVQDPARVEWYYARHFYPVYTYLPTILFSWLPFSLGDLFYVFASVSLIFLLGKGITCLLRRHWNRAILIGLKLVTALFLLHHLFYLSWGLHYYREPLAKKYNLNVENIRMEDYKLVLDSIIGRANNLRQQIDLSAMRTSRNVEQLERIMATDSTFDAMLSKKHIRAKRPISSTLVSYFTVNGYFNPFTHEVQVNALIPWSSFPFTVAHELSHQMGIGFEDECNFIAYQVLASHPNPWYAYSAHYAAIQSLLGAIRYTHPEVFQKYFNRLDPRIVEDLRVEREFWSRYTGPVDYISGIIYNQYLQHNNQPEGTQRYGMMNRLIVAWQKSRGF